MSKLTSIPKTHSEEFMSVVEFRIRGYLVGPHGKGCTLDDIYSWGTHTRVVQMRKKSPRFWYCRCEREYQDEMADFDANAQGDCIDVLLVDDGNRHWLINDIIGKGLSQVWRIPDVLLVPENIPECYASKLHRLPEWIRVSCPELGEGWDSLMERIRQNPDSHLGFWAKTRPELVGMMERGELFG
jgi:hypothetical protein